MKNTFHTWLLWLSLSPTMILLRKTTHKFPNKEAFADAKAMVINMDTVIANLPILIPALIAVSVLAYLAHRTRRTGLFTVIEGAVTLAVFCFMIYSGASLEELLLTVLALLLPSLMLRDNNGRS